MRRLTMISCVGLLGCASSGASTGASSPQETVRISGGVGLPTTTVDTHPTTANAVTTVGFTVDRVWSVLQAVYDSLGIPVSTTDPASHTIGTAGMRVRRRLGGVAMSKYIDCGSTQGGVSADSYEIVLSVRTSVERAEQGMSRLVTSLDAQGRPVTISSEYTRCTSTGGLEKRIADMVTAKLNR